MRPPFETFKGATCRGCYALGTACGVCEKCVWERAQLPVMEVVDPLDQLAMSLQWDDSYKDEYKRRVIREAILQVLEEKR